MRVTLLVDVHPSRHDRAARRSERLAIDAQRVDGDITMARRKTKTPATTVIPAERIERSILVIRGEKVLLDSDLAAL